MACSEFVVLRFCEDSVKKPIKPLGSHLEYLDHLQSSQGKSYENHYYLEHLFIFLLSSCLLLVQVLQSSQLTPAMSNVSCMGYEQLQLRCIETI